MFTKALNSNLNLQRFKVLYICGNYSSVLSRLGRNFTELEVRRAFTFFQLMTILEENHHGFLIVEHDPMLYEDAKEMVEYVAQALKQTSREATILLCSPALDPHLQKMMELADRVSCFYDMQGAGAAARVEASRRISKARPPGRPSHEMSRGTKTEAHGPLLCRISQMLRLAGRTS
jgi:hypothetical protein